MVNFKFIINIFEVESINFHFVNSFELVFMRALAHTIPMIVTVIPDDTESKVVASTGDSLPRVWNERIVTREDCQLLTFHKNQDDRYI